MSGTALYLYCVVPADRVPMPLASPALDGGPVHSIRFQDLAVLAHRCEPEPYQGSEEEVRGWIAAHNAVVEEAWQAAASVLPMSFDVIVKGEPDQTAEANLAGWLAGNRQQLTDRLRDLEGRVEVAVVVLCDPERLVAPGAAPAASGTAPAVPAQRARGRAFFDAQQRRREVAAEIERRAGERAHRYRAELSGLAGETRDNEPRPVPGRRTLLSVSLLLPRGGITAVGEYLDQLSREPGVTVRFTGPWPPYSFATAQFEPGSAALALSSQSISSSARRRMLRASAENRSA